LILLPHGGPHGVSDNWFFDDDAQFLASRGYAVLQVNPSFGDCLTPTP
jgi:dipeptidyl aminopeptidase/acylaminoacyl peptidase